MKILSAVLALLFVDFLNADEKPTASCLYGRGSICDNQLLGYVYCDGKSSVGVYHKCNPGFMCACGIRRKCNGMKPCIKRPDLPKVPMNFIVSFTGQYDISSGGISRGQHLSGAVYQDFTTKSFRRRTDYSDIKNEGRIFSSRVTELILKANDSNTYVSYVLSEYPDGGSHCSVSKVPTFNDLFYDLRLRSYEHPHFTYVYLEGPIDGGDKSYKQTWEYENLLGVEFAPGLYTSYDSGTTMSKTSTNRTVNYHYFYYLHPNPDYFRIPPQCLKKKDDIDRSSYLEFVV